MEMLDLRKAPATDPTLIYRYRDGLYAADLLGTALVWLDFFSWLHSNQPTKPPFASTSRSRSVRRMSCSRFSPQLHDAHINADKTGPLHVAEYSAMLMHSTEGKCYSISEMDRYLTEAGFLEVNFTPTAAARSMITARKP